MLDPPPIFNVIAVVGLAAKGLSYWDSGPESSAWEYHSFWKQLEEFTNWLRQPHHLDSVHQAPIDWWEPEGHSLESKRAAILATLERLEEIQESANDESQQTIVSSRPEVLDSFVLDSPNYAVNHHHHDAINHKKCRASSDHYFRGPFPEYHRSVRHYHTLDGSAQAIDLRERAYLVEYMHRWHSVNPTDEIQTLLPT